MTSVDYSKTLRIALGFENIGFVSASVSVPEIGKSCDTMIVRHGKAKPIGDVLVNTAHYIDYTYVGFSKKPNIFDCGEVIIEALRKTKAAGIDCSKFLSVECNVDLSMLFHNIQQYSNATDKYEYDRLVKKFDDYCLDLLPHGYYTTLIENFNCRMYPGELAYELYDLYAKRELLLLRCYNSATHQSNVDVSVRKSLIGKLLELTDGPGFALCITTQSIAIFDRCVSRHQYEKEDVSILMAAAIQLSVAYFHIRHHDMHLPCVELFVGEINVTNEKDVSSNFVGKSVYVRNRLNLFPFFLFMLFRTTIGKWQLLAWRVPSNTIFHPKMLFCQTFRFS